MWLRLDKDTAETLYENGNEILFMLSNSNKSTPLKVPMKSESQSLLKFK